jgi:hypothetical protein
MLIHDGRGQRQGKHDAKKQAALKDANYHRRYLYLPPIVHGPEKRFM